MKQVSTAAILYKMMNYSDRSAVALAFSPDYGKIKLFMPKAYSKKGGFMTFVPGSVTFNMKETSDLHRFLAFNHDPAFYHYTHTPEIMMRMHLCFDFFDHLFQPGDPCRVMWNLALKFDENNYRKVSLYTIYRLFREAGLMFGFHCKCGKLDGELWISGGEILCESCGKMYSEGSIKMTPELVANLARFQDNNSFRELQLNSREELEMVRFFSSYMDSVTGRENTLKSVNVFISMDEYGEGLPST